MKTMSNKIDNENLIITFLKINKTIIIIPNSKFKSNEKLSVDYLDYIDYL